MAIGKLAIIGHPIKHALSPLLHMTAFSHLGMAWTYEAIDVTDIEVGGLVARLEQEGYAGFNITIPHKQRVMEFLTELDATAKACGAVNTVVFDRGVRLGMNTDVIGVRESLRPHQAALRGKKALVLGAGGAARACVFALVKMLDVGSVTVAARDEAKAAAMLKGMEIEGTVIPLEGTALQKEIESSAAIVNATPVGMVPDTQASPLPAPVTLAAGQIAFDSVYRPLETEFLRRAAADGATPVGGLDMLVHQGAAAFHRWTGREMPLAVVREAVLKELERRG